MQGHPETVKASEQKPTPNWDCIVSRFHVVPSKAVSVAHGTSSLNDHTISSTRAPSLRRSARVPRPHFQVSLIPRENLRGGNSTFYPRFPFFLNTLCTEAAWSSWFHNRIPMCLSKRRGAEPRPRRRRLWSQSPTTSSRCSHSC